MLAAVGHDLRTPLATLQAAVEAMQDGVAADPDRYLRAMATDLELLRGMVDDLLVLTGLEAGELRLEHIPLDLAELADGAAEALTPVATRQQVTIELEATGAVPVHGDGRALDRVLRNLLDNAMRHPPPNSTITVELATDGDTGEVRVHDEGPGLPHGLRRTRLQRLLASGRSPRAPRRRGRPRAGDRP